MRVYRRRSEREVFMLYSAISNFEPGCYCGSSISFRSTTKVIRDVQRGKSGKDMLVLTKKDGGPGMLF
jgi:hypothetical protein